MQSIVKVRAVNKSRFLAIPKYLAEKVCANYMAVEIDDHGKLIYTPISEALVSAGD